MRRLVALLAGLLLALSSVGTASAAINFSQKVVDQTHPLQVFVHQAADGTLGAKASWSGTNCWCSPDSLTMTIVLVDQPTAAFQEIDYNGENCSIGGAKVLECYVGAPAFEKGGFAPAGWYMVRLEEFHDTFETNAKVSITGNIDQTVLFPS